jgi:hypothetical protein
VLYQHPFDLIIQKLPLLYHSRYIHVTWVTIYDILFMDTEKGSDPDEGKEQPDILALPKARAMRKTVRFVSLGEAASVPMAQGRHLFPCRTQKLSLAAVTILGVHPWENSTVPNYTIDHPQRVVFVYS